MTQTVTSQTRKEAIADQLVRFVRLLPYAPGGITINAFGTSDIQESTVAILYEQKEADIYFKLLDRALALVMRDEIRDEAGLTAAVDIVEIVKKNLTSGG